MCTAALPSMLQSSAAARIDFITTTTTGWDPRLHCSFMVHRALHLRNQHYEQRESQEEETHASLMSQHPKKHLSEVHNGMVYYYFPRSGHFSSSLRRTFCRRRQERQLESTIVQSQLGKAPGFHPPQKTTAARALHIKNSPTHKAQHWWIRWHLLHHIHVLTVSLYICCQLLSRGEKHFPVFIWQPLHEAISHDLRIN